MLPPRKKIAMSSLIRMSFEAFVSLTLSDQGSLPPYFSPYFWLFVPFFPGFCTGRVFFVNSLFLHWRFDLRASFAPPPLRDGKLLLGNQHLDG